jgi:hypothetical protein
MTSRHPRQRLISLRLMLGASAAVVAAGGPGHTGCIRAKPIGCLGGVREARNIRKTA